MLKRDFNIALLYAGLTKKQWAESRNIGFPLLSLVLHGKGKSARVTALIEDFVAEQLPKLAEELTRAA